MKKFIALLLALMCLVPTFASCGTTTTEAPATPTESPSSSEEAEIPYKEQDLKQSYGVYNIVTMDGKKVSIDNKGKFVLDYKDELTARFTFHLKERIEDGFKVRYYALYKGDDETRTVEVSTFLPDKANLLVKNSGYNAPDKALWTIENYEDGTCRVIPKTSHPDMPICLSVLEDGTVGIAARNENDKNQIFKIEKLPSDGEKHSCL